MSSADLERRIAYLESRLDRAEREIGMRNIKPTKGSPVNIDRIIVYGGNTLGDGQPGIAKTSTITNIPSAYDPSAAPSTINGIGYGQWYRNGVFRAWVLICNDGSLATAVNADLIGDGSGGPDSDVCTLAGTKTVTVGGDPNTLATVYIPDIS